MSDSRARVVLALVLMGIVLAGWSWRALVTAPTAASAPGQPAAGGASVAGGAGNTEAGDAVAAFLASHWAQPIAPQGAPPSDFSTMEVSLAPAACGSCHAQQYADWRQSLHSRAMGPGLKWQLHVMGQQAGNDCLRCHAPLAEQKALVARERQWPAAPASAPPAYVPATLADDGLVCAACHVRQHQRFGPPPRQASPSGPAPHGGFAASAAFQDSRFCATCHQFPEDGPRTAGKLREDTLSQWQDTRFAREGQQCQGCHMPDRRHHWRGIHDPAMVRAALSVELAVKAQGAAGRQVVATLRNTGAGHHFPTYMVPKVTARLWLLPARGGERLLAEHVIGWQVSVDLAQEAFDTRLPAGEAASLAATVAAVRPGDRVELRVDVAPAEHYERMYRDMLGREAKLAPAAAGLLRQALAEAEAKRFEGWRLQKPL